MFNPGGCFSVLTLAAANPLFRMTLAPKPRLGHAEGSAMTRLICDRLVMVGHPDVTTVIQSLDYQFPVILQAELMMI